MALDRKAVEDAATAWIAAWNSHDLDRIVDQFSDDVELVSPRVMELLGDPRGTIRGRTALRAYFQRGLTAAPELRFTLERVYVGVKDFAIQYRRHDGRSVVETLELDAEGRVRRAVVYYSSGPRTS